MGDNMDLHHVLVRSIKKMDDENEKHRAYMVLGKYVIIYFIFLFLGSWLTYG